MRLPVSLHLEAVTFMRNGFELFSIAPQESYVDRESRTTCYEWDVVILSMTFSFDVRVIF